ncbi:uncharacterized protein zgc:113184 isoform X2 [Alosa sapidissima]|nr:uncharacterized protein zgc:113184 isoform X2 [Alosa sapidissima]XP_041945902.1 uncharacterized protein zgc:113184 isoform X2 [Alosa sapidissima]XP_041945903.1 uncharacterized protein zgc:113184 isoform X2 [Alosa sapidissima]
MEDAYTALYQEFLRLRSICFKQATMLQHLTEVLNNQQGGIGDSENLVSMPAQCSQGDLINFCSDAHELLLRRPLDQSAETNTTRGGGGVTAVLLTSGMDQLHLARPQHQASLGAGAVAGLEGPSTSPGVIPSRAPPSIIGDLKRAEQQWAENNPARARRPWSSSSFLNSEWMSLTGGRVMSRVTVESQVCEFCQAVFPGHTTTRGEFLRHLTSHIT